MGYQVIRNSILVILALGLIAVALQFFPAQPGVRAQASDNVAVQNPSPSPTPREELPQDSDEVLRVETNLTNIFFTAADRNKRFIQNLKKEDIQVLEDGQPQEIFTFQQNTDLPLSIAILIDCSSSEERTLPDLKRAARAFLEAVMRPNKDEAAIITFTGEVTLEQGFTGNIERLRQAIERVEFIPPSGYIGRGVVLDSRVPSTPPISDTNQILAGSTALWDAVWAASNDLLGESAENTRRAIILLTDGVDTISQVKIKDAIQRAQKADALVYAIGIGDSYNFGVDEGSLKKIAGETGGRPYFPHSQRELNEAFDQIQRDLREQYLVAYSPSNKTRDGSYRKVQILVVDPQMQKEKLKLNYRPGYFSKTTEAPSRKR